VGEARRSRTWCADVSPAEKNDPAGGEEDAIKRVCKTSGLLQVGGYYKKNGGVLQTTPQKWGGTLLQSEDFNYETWFYSTTTG